MSEFIFFDPSGQNRPVALVYTTTTGAKPADAASYNIEVFTGPNPGIGTLDPGFDGAVYMPSATPVASNVAVSPGFNDTVLSGQVGIEPTAWPNTATVIAGGSSVFVNGNQYTNDPFSGFNGRLGNQIVASSVAGGSLFVTAGIGDTVIGGAGPTTVWGGGHFLSFLAQQKVVGKSDSIVGGAGGMTVQGGARIIQPGADPADATIVGPSSLSVSGGTGPLLVVNLLGQSSVTGGAGNLEIDDPGLGNTIAGALSGTTMVRDNYPIEPLAPHRNGGNNLIVGGNGSASLPSTLPGAAAGTTMPGYGGVNTAIVGGPEDTIIGGAGTTYIDGTVGGETITGGSGTVAGSVAGRSGTTGTTVVGGNADSIVGGTGTLEVDIEANRGVETVNLSAANRGAAILRDVSTTGANAATTVMGFNNGTDAIASRTSVNNSGAFIGTSTVSGGNTLLTFVDGSVMTLVGFTSSAAIRFVQ